MARRKNPTISEHPQMDMDKHERMTSEMRDALYSLENKIRKPFVMHGEKLLPATLRTRDLPGADKARKHIERLHKAFKKTR